jgi:hypothetical protein
MPRVHGGARPVKARGDGNGSHEKCWRNHVNKIIMRQNQVNQNKCRFNAFEEPK